MPAVSVIVPVYEPGAPLDDLVASLVAQTLPAEDFEVILVDDGSADGTPERLEALAARHPNFRACSIEHSGWPSRPRNVGLGLARGDYVFFADQDDRLDPAGLERLVARAREDGADVVVGKVVGHGKSVATVLFTRDRRDVTPEWGPLVRLLTPHKLFRRAFLEEHGIRFPDDGRRLEDHVFVLSAYFAGARVSVLASRPVYHWIRHEPGANASSRRMDPESYYARVRELLDLVDRHMPPGAARDRVYAHYLRSKLLNRVGGEGFLKRGLEHGRAVFDAVRDLQAERFPVELDRRLQLRHRLRSQLVRADDMAALRRLARLERRLRADVVLVSRTRRGEVLDLRLEAALRVGREPLAVRMRGVRLVCEQLSQALSGDEDGAAEVDLAPVLPHAAAELQLVSAADGTPFPLRCRHDVRLDPLEDRRDRFTPVLIVEATIDPRRAAAGAPLWPGRWELRVAPVVGGYTATAERARLARDPERPRRPVRITIGEDGRLPAPPAPLPPRTVRARAVRRLPAPVRSTLRRARRAVA